MAKNLTLSILSALFLSLSLGSNKALSDELVVITSTETAIERASIQQIKNRWLQNTFKIEDVQVEVIDLNEGSDLRNSFYEDMLGVSDNELKAHWAIKVFRGEGFPPKTLENTNDILSWITSKPNRIGYMFKKDLNDKVKILYVMPE